MKNVLPENKPLFFSNSVYDKLKWVAQYLLPGFAALYFALAQIWGLPHAEQIIGTTAALDTFLGLLLGASTKRYKNSDRQYDGSFVVDRIDPHTEKYALEVDGPFENLAKKAVVSFKVKSSKAGNSSSSQ